MAGAPARSQTIPKLLPAPCSPGLHNEPAELHMVRRALAAARSTWKQDREHLAGQHEARLVQLQASHETATARTKIKLRRSKDTVQMLEQQVGGGTTFRVILGFRASG